MKKQLQYLLPVSIFFLVIVALVGVRVYRMGALDQPADTTTQLYDNGLGKDGIPALNAPKYVDVATADEILADSVSGISVESDGQARFYSFQILNWHELVNDTFAGQDLLVSYSPLCGSAVVYERLVDGASRTFGDVGLVRNNCAVLYDSFTDTTWDQATGRALSGKDKGKELTRYASTVLTWGDWKSQYPYGEVLSTETGFTRTYRVHPYGGYETSPSIFFPVDVALTRGTPKEVVYDFVAAGEHIGLMTTLVAFMGDLSVDVGEGDGTQRLAAVLDGSAVHLFDRVVDGTILTLSKDGNVITDKETGSTWDNSGRATKGKLKGTQLVELVPTAQYYAFAYVAEFPEAILPGASVFDEAVRPNKEIDPENTINVGE